MFQSYRGLILYLRWWALCKMGRSAEAAQIARRLLDQYPSSPYAAPILMERATDALVRQEYDECRKWLTEIVVDFAGTEAAEQAMRILIRLQERAVDATR